MPFGVFSIAVVFSFSSIIYNTKLLLKYAKRGDDGCLLQALAICSALRVTQKVRACGLALRVVCVIFLKTCPRTPQSHLQTFLNEYMRFLQSLDNLEDQEHLYHDNVLAERFRYRRSEISFSARNAKLVLTRFTT